MPSNPFKVICINQDIEDDDNFSYQNMFHKLRVYTFVLEPDNQDRFNGTVYILTEGRLKGKWKDILVWISEPALRDNFRILSDVPKEP